MTPILYEAVFKPAGRQTLSSPPGAAIVHGCNRLLNGSDVFLQRLNPAVADIRGEGPVGPDRHFRLHLPEAHGFFSANSSSALSCANNSPWSLMRLLRARKCAPVNAGSLE